MTLPTPPTQERKTIAFHGCDKVHYFRWEHKTLRLETEEKQEARPFLAERDDSKCQECGVILPDVQQYTVDHTRRWRDESGHWLYDNHVEFLRLLCNPCNSRVQHQRRGHLPRPMEKREREIDGQAHTHNTAEEIIRHDEGLPLVIHKVIERVKDGWKDLVALQKAAHEDLALDNGHELKRAIKRLKYGQIAGSISNETKISLQTVYSYLFAFKNEWNGWVRVGNFPEGNLVVFADTRDFDRSDGEIFARVYDSVVMGRQTTRENEDAGGARKQAPANTSDSAKSA